MCNFSVEFVCNKNDIISVLPDNDDVISHPANYQAIVFVIFVTGTSRAALVDTIVKMAVMLQLAPIALSSSQKERK